MVQGYHVATFFLRSWSTYSLTHSVDVTMYGWYGGFEPRNSNGELSEDPVSIQYIEYNKEVFMMVADSNIFNPLTFRVNFVPNAETTPPPPPTEGPSIEAGGPPTVIILSVAVGGGLGVMVILLIIVLVCVFGRRRSKDKPKRKPRRR